jgi:hypothetical protein
MVIGCSFIWAIGTYLIHGFNGYFIGGFLCLLMVIGGYTINDH